MLENAHLQAFRAWNCRGSVARYSPYAQAVPSFAAAAAKLAIAASFYDKRINYS
jgi:hypothetical protein